MKNKKVYIEEVNYLEADLESLADDGDKEKYLLNYPTVYIVNNKEQEEYLVYVGETSDIKNRTREHLTADSKNRADWEYFSQALGTKMYVIGHEYFNKSLTLDIENRLMLYLSSVEGIKSLFNRRTNQQNDYYTSEYLDQIFSKVWRKLRTFNPDLFPLERIIKDSALFKASPFHKLTKEQMDAKEKIKMQIYQALQSNETGQLILVKGAAGAGKTVLLSSLFYELFQESQNENEFNLGDLDNYLLVNHDEQLTVYQQIADRLFLFRKDDQERVIKPTSFINNREINQKADVSLIDEAHLLWTQGKQSYRGKNQLKDIVDRSKVTVAVFDPDQVLQTNQYWEEDTLRNLSESEPIIISLHNQMRINSNEHTLNWIRTLIDEKNILQVPEDNTYDLQIFDSIHDLENEIGQKAESEEFGLSRLLAIYDWPYNANSQPDDKPYWNVTLEEEDWEKPWNRELNRYDRKQKRETKGLAWAEQAHTINEVGSTYTIQGFDLNYAGVIIGPSVGYEDRKIVYCRDESKNRQNTIKRTMNSGEKADLSEELLKNQLNVLLTRGVNGLYIYAVDKNLRKALREADKRGQHE